MISVFDDRPALTAHATPPHLPVVPRPHSNLILCAVVDSSNVVQDILPSLLFRVHEHCVI